jgi:HEAT repeats
MGATSPTIVPMQSRLPMLVATMGVLAAACNGGREDFDEAALREEAGRFVRGLDDATLREMTRLAFPPTFAKDDAPFDVNTTLFEGESVAKLLAVVHNGTAKEKCDALLGVGHVNHGCEGHTKHTIWDRPDRETRRQILYLAATGRTGPRAPLLLPHVIDALADPQVEVREMAAIVLAGFGAEGLPACDALRRCLRDEDTGVRLAAARALYEIRFETHAPIVIAVGVLQSNPDGKLRERAVRNLAVMGHDARPAIAALEAAEQDVDHDVAQGARWALDVVR